MELVYYIPEAIQMKGLPKEAKSYLLGLEAQGSDRITCWRAKSIERRRGSKIQGQGLFTTEDLEPGQIIAIKPGHVVDGRTIREKAGIIKGSHQQIGPNQFLTGLTEEEVDKNLVGYNHSCEPNTKVVVVKGLHIAFLVTMKQVQKGDEVTADYSVSQMTATHTIICNCGSPHCRRLIQPAADWKKENFQKAHMDEFPWFIKEEIERSRGGNL